MTSPMIRVALAVALATSAAAAAVPARAQTELSNAQIVQGLQGLTENAPVVTAQSLRQAALDHLNNFPGAPLTRPPLAIQLDKLAQITVQIQFKLNSAMILPASYGALGSIADAMHNPVLQGYKFIVTGNTDATGSRQYNMKLSQERADAIVEALTTVFNVSPARLEAVGLGEESLQDTKNPDSPVNRRVQIFNVGPLKR